MPHKPTIVPITSFREAIPKERTWYSYGEDIFVSVICGEGRKSHFRSKTLQIQNRKDNVLSEWHRDWQYNQIEYFHGKIAKGQKTYEIPIVYEGEKHIIDSLVGIVAIEFQHTLSVLVKELDLRYIAHLNHGYLPYLVLDFTDYTIPRELLENRKYNKESIKNLVRELKENAKSIPLWNRLLKWMSSKHFFAGNLFVDFRDGLVRFNENLTNGCMILDKVDFIHNIQFLENFLQEKIQLDNDELIRIKSLREAEAEKVIKERLELQQIENAQREKEEQMAKQKALEINKRLKTEDSRYEKFRNIINNQLVSPYLTQYDFNKLLVEQESHSISTGSSYYNYYVFLCDDVDILMQYKTHTEAKGYNFISSEIKISRREGFEIRTFTFMSTSKHPWRLTEKRTELAQGYLHSLKHAALINYDDKGSVKEKKFFIHNKEIDSEIFSSVAELFDCIGLPIEYYQKDLTQVQYNQLQKIYHEIHEEDTYKFVIGIIWNSGIPSYNFESYYDEKEIIMEVDIVKKYFTKDA